ncbi:metalloregulator ArsR/SmtB family transcription factor [Geotalea sp. SG265]|uniref:ArsR/SmtB family transcription factor n=1 Tax=Geotalea sp. SG265 TaxID=2922867 RepID=UPI001FAFA631|nr:metalloregulator ArsR/SmtB family transcription factor [Geotalea sp. SG265]
MKDIAKIFQSLDEETRLRILALLLHEQELCVCDIMAVLQLPQSTASRHLSHLKNIGWLQDRRVGLWVYYSIVKQLDPLQQTLLPILRHFLHDSPDARADLERLRSFGTKNCCA